MNKIITLSIIALIYYSTHISADENVTESSPQSKDWITQIVFQNSKQIAQLEALSTKPEDINKINNRIDDHKTKIAVINNEISGRLHAQDNRISDIDKSISKLDINLTIFTIIVSIAGVLLGLSVWYKAAREAEKAANSWLADNAKPEIKNLKDSATEELNQTQETLSIKLREEIENGRAAIQKLITESEGKVNSSLEKISEEANIYLETMYNGAKEKEKEKEIVHQLDSETAKNKREQQILERYNLAVNKYENEEYNEALTLIEQNLKKRIASTASHIDHLFFKCLLLDNLERYEEQLEPLEKIIELGSSSEPEKHEENVLKAMHDKGSTLYQLGRFEEAIEVFEYIRDTFKEKYDVHSDIISNGMLCLSASLERVDRGDEAIGVLKDIITNFSDSENNHVKEEVAKSFIQKATAHMRKDEYYKATETFKEFIEHYKDYENDLIQDWIDRSKVNLGFLLNKQNSPKEAIIILKNLVEEKYTDKDNNKEILVHALANISISEGALKMKENQLLTLEKALEVISEDPEMEVAEADIMFRKGNILKELRMTFDEINTYEKITKRFKDSERTETKLTVLKAMFAKAMKLGEIGAYSEALEEYDHILKQYGHEEDDPFKRGVTESMCNAAEISLHCEPKEKSLTRLYSAIERAEKIDTFNAIAKFIEFYLDEISIKELISVLKEIPDGTKFTWKFEEMYSLITKQEGKKRAQLEAFIRYFESHNNLEKLSFELGELE